MFSEEKKGWVCLWHILPMDFKYFTCYLPFWGVLSSPQHAPALNCASIHSKALWRWTIAGPPYAAEASTGTQKQPRVHVPRLPLLSFLCVLASMPDWVHGSPLLPRAWVCEGCFSSFHRPPGLLGSWPPPSIFKASTYCLLSCLTSALSSHPFSHFVDLKKKNTFIHFFCRAPVFRHA